MHGAVIMVCKFAQASCCPHNSTPAISSPQRMLIVFVFENFRVWSLWMSCMWCMSCVKKPNIFLHLRWLDWFTTSYTDTGWHEKETPHRQLSNSGKKLYDSSIVNFLWGFQLLALQLGFHFSVHENRLEQPHYHQCKLHASQVQLLLLLLLLCVIQHICCLSFCCTTCLVLELETTFMWYREGGERISPAVSLLSSLLAALSHFQHM